MEQFSKNIYSDRGKEIVIDKKVLAQKLYDSIDEKHGVWGYAVITHKDPFTTGNYAVIVRFEAGLYVGKIQFFKRTSLFEEYCRTMEVISGINLKEICEKIAVLAMKYVET